ncbi:MAG: response regulator, partial [Chloroflexi bacterium]|nr:response regulator [Chloroflexota bacterium]
MNPILLIDDDPVLLERVANQRQTAGYRAQTANDGATG